MREFLILWGKISVGMAVGLALALAIAILIAAALGTWGAWWSGIALFVGVSLFLALVFSDP